MTYGALAGVLGEIDLVTALGLAGVRSAVVAKRGTPAWYSRYVVARIEWADPALAPETLVERLLAFASCQPEAPVLYFDSDWDLLVVSRYRDELAPAFRFVVARPDVGENLVDKARFHELASTMELPVPSAVSIPLVAGAPPEIALRFPLVAKPLTRRATVWGPLAAAKAIHVADEQALRDVWAHLARAGVGVIRQEAVPGTEARIESYHAYVDESGAVAGEFTGRKLRTHPATYGFSTALAVTRIDDVLELGRDLMRRLGVTGVAKLDFKRDPDGRLWLLEVNPRFNLWHHPGALAGVNIPALVYADLMGAPRPARRAGKRVVHWCSLAHDYQAARETGMPLLPWAWWTLRCEAKSGLSLRDPLPLVRAASFRIAKRIGTRRTRSEPSGGRRW